MKNYSLLLTIVFLGLSSEVSGQCFSDYPKHQSDKIANYDIEVSLDIDTKTADCHQKLTWKNTSPDTIKSFQFYMYMNAFKNPESSYLRGTKHVFRQDITKRKPNEWGFIDISSMRDAQGNELSESFKYIQPDDQNPNDQTVLSVSLATPIHPGETGSYTIDFKVKLPKTISRSGYSQHDFFMFVHWFPQLGVYEADQQDEWYWNCHQFMRGTEFYADFGDYNIKIDAPKHLVIGASGCRIQHAVRGNRQIIEFQAHDLIDFGWVAYPDFDMYTSTYQGIDIEILMPPEHSAFAPRYLEAVQMSISYMTKHVGPYPYPKITVVDPPVHALNSGFMEYPMMITGASFFGIPRCLRSVESLVVHEFNHMYFMATLASNEKESPWLDEGFVTYFEDRVTDNGYGRQKAFYNFLGFSSGNTENSRLEYVSLPDPSVGIIARPGWEIKKSYKGLVYAKTATMLKTLEHLIGQKRMDHVIKSYYKQYKFKHPREEHFRKIVKEVLDTAALGFIFDSDDFFDQCLYDTGVCDYAIGQVINHTGFSTVTLINKGTLHIPVPWRVQFADGYIQRGYWSGKGSKTLTFNHRAKIQSAEIDPDRTILLDTNLNNNGVTLAPNKLPLLKYASKSTNWIQTIFNLASWLL